MREYLLIPADEMRGAQIQTPQPVTSDVGLPKQTPYYHALKLDESSNQLLNKTTATPEMRLRLYNNRQNMYRRHVKESDDQPLANKNFEIYASILPQAKRSLGKSLLSHITREKIATLDRSGFIRPMHTSDKIHSTELLRSLLLANEPLKDEQKHIINHIIPKLPDSYKKNRALKTATWDSY
jgi:hypothetical protein